MSTCSFPSPHPPHLWLTPGYAGERLKKSCDGVNPPVRDVVKVERRDLEYVLGLYTKLLEERPELRHSDHDGRIHRFHIALGELK